MRMTAARDARMNEKWDQHVQGTWVRCDMCIILSSVLSAVTLWCHFLVSLSVVILWCHSPVSLSGATL